MRPRPCDRCIEAAAAARGWCNGSTASTRSLGRPWPCRSTILSQLISRSSRSPSPARPPPSPPSPPHTTENLQHLRLWHGQHTHTAGAPDNPRIHRWGHCVIPGGSGCWAAARTPQAVPAIVARVVGTTASPSHQRVEESLGLLLSRLLRQAVIRLIHRLVAASARRPTVTRCTTGRPPLHARRRRPVHSAPPHRAARRGDGRRAAAPVPVRSTAGRRCREWRTAQQPAPARAHGLTTARPDGTGQLSPSRPAPPCGPGGVSAAAAPAGDYMRCTDRSGFFAACCAGLAGHPKPQIWSRTRPAAAAAADFCGGMLNRLAVRIPAGWTGTEAAGRSQVAVAGD
jgi:hypothetical protein